MENLLNYLLYALFGHNVTDVKSHECCGHKTWIIVLEDKVYFALDKNDIDVIRSIYNKRFELLESDERERYEMIFNLCK